MHACTASIHVLGMHHEAHAGEVHSVQIEESSVPVEKADVVPTEHGQG